MEGKHPVNSGAIGIRVSKCKFESPISHTSFLNALYL